MKADAYIFSFVFKYWRTRLWLQGRRRQPRRVPRAPQVLDSSRDLVLLLVEGLKCQTAKTGGASLEPTRSGPWTKGPRAHEDRAGAGVQERKEVVR